MINNPEHPLVSVIIPCFNVENYVEQSIRSILQQSYNNMEVWIIDDASTDKTLEKIKNFSDKRIIVTALDKNTGKIGAVNEILQKVNGDLIAFQDADDWSERNKIEKQVDEFRRNNLLGICFTDYKNIPRDFERKVKPAITNLELKDEFLGFGTKKNISFIPTCCPSMMISKATLNRTGGYHEYFTGKVAEDIHWIYRILKTFEGITIDEVLYNYRSREGSLTDIQFSGRNPKAAYTWKLLAKIIHQDMHKQFNVLSPENSSVLKELELQSCEEQLKETIIQLNRTRKIYENSNSFRLGKFLLSPVQIFKKLRSKHSNF